MGRWARDRSPRYRRSKIRSRSGSLVEYAGTWDLVLSAPAHTAIALEAAARRMVRRLRR